MRHLSGADPDVKSSVLAGAGERDNHRSNFVWGKGGHGLLTALLALVLPLVLIGAPAAAAGSPPTYTAFMTSTLSSAVKKQPGALYNVIIKGARGQSTGTVSNAATGAIQKNPSGTVKMQFSVINGVSATMSGAAIQALAKNTAIKAIVQDSKVGATALSNTQPWADSTQVSSYYVAPLAAPAIAVVDSGVDASRAADFGARVIQQVNFVSGNANARDTDGFGHGTFVAGIAAGGAAGYSGAAPGANIVSLDVLDDSGAGSETDVINACEWLYKNASKYNIKVANFSLLAGSNASFMYDPLDQAIEKLWLSGIVVVTAAGNFASNGQPSGIPYAPANDPFAITVGAADVNGTVSTLDDFNAPWSAYGYTLDGFAKPDLGAPGRYMNGAVPTTSTIYTQHPDRAVAPGYMWMSGTSFSAPVVAGIAADLLALHPTWTPDQVKGALMLTAARTSSTTGTNALGVGEVQAVAAAAVVTPPNPNAGLDNYIVSDPSGGVSFDAASWSSAAQANASWNSASWSSASWSSASWSSASWSSGQTTDGTLPDASWSSLIWVG